jgi:hypothetical protein
MKGSADVVAYLPVPRGGFRPIADFPLLYFPPFYWSWFPLLFVVRDFSVGKKKSKERKIEDNM